MPNASRSSVASTSYFSLTGSVLTDVSQATAVRTGAASKNDRGCGCTVQIKCAVQCSAILRLSVSKHEHRKARSDIGRACIQMTHECTAHPLLITEATSSRNNAKSSVTLFNGLTSSLNTDQFDCLGRSHPRAGGEASSEVAQTHVGLFGQRLCSQVGVKIVRNPSQKGS